MASNLSSGNAKLNYHQAITVYIHWLIRECYIENNPLVRVYKHKPVRRLSPIITEKDVDTLINTVDNLRDKCIMSLLVDSEMRLSELANIKACDMHLDGWEDLDMVLKYTRSITFNDCLIHYNQVNQG